MHILKNIIKFKPFSIFERQEYFLTLNRIYRTILSGSEKKKNLNGERKKVKEEERRISGASKQNISQQQGNLKEFEDAGRSGSSFQIHIANLGER